MEECSESSDEEESEYGDDDFFGFWREKVYETISRPSYFGRSRMDP
jgi:hypothetical protein